MENRGRVSLLVTVFAALAVLFPVLGARTPEHPPVETKALRGKSETPAGESANREFPSVKDLIAHFLSSRVGERATPAEMSASAAYRIEFLIATVPDPIDSRLPNLFDSFVESIGSATEATGYTLDRFALPWMEEIDSGEKRPLPWRQTLYDSVPGLVLFRKRDAQELLLVLLVGETPTTGIHKQAMFSALDQVAQFYPWGPRQGGLQGYPQLKAESCSEPLRVMGPAFSGSAVSLRLVLDSWLTSHADLPQLRIRMISGSATGVGASLLSQVGHGRASFQATVPPDRETLTAAECYIGSLGYPRIAILTERNTAYGQNLAHDIAASGKGSNQAQSLCPGTSKVPKIEILDLPFPLHISNLRNAAIQEARAQQQTGSGSESANPVSAPLATEDTGEPREVVPPFSDLTVRSAELTLSNLFSTIARERYRYVGIVATDVRDAMFLAREVRLHCPATVLFTLNANLLYAASEVNRFTRGMLVFTPYPLFNLEQFWTYPYGGGETRHQFSVQAAEGVYNATLALLHQESKMIDYGSPLASFAGAGQQPPYKPSLWVTAIGNGETLPISLLRPDDYASDDDAGYTYSLVFPAETSDPKAPKPDVGRGLYNENAMVVVTVLSLLVSTFCVMVLAQYRRSGKKKATSRFSALLGDTAAHAYWSEGRLFLLCCCASLLAFYLVVAADFCLPFIAGRELGPSVEMSRTPEVAMAVAAIAITFLLLLWATVALAAAYHASPAGQKGSALSVTLFAILALILVFVLEVSLLHSWYESVRKLPASGLFSFLRSFDLRGGLSPLLPLSCVTAAACLWAFCSFRRLRLIDVLRASGTAEKNDAWLNFLSLEGRSFNGVCDLENNIKHHLESASVVSLGGYLGLLALALLGAFYFFGERMVRPIDAPAFYWIFATAFFIVYWALFMEFIRLVLAWRGLHLLLQRFSWHPLHAAFKRYQERFPSRARINLTHPPYRFAALESSIEQAGCVLRTARTLEQTAEADAELRELLRQSLPEWEAQVQTAEGELCEALRLEWIDLSQIEGHPARGRSHRKHVSRLRGDWRMSLRAQHRAHQALFRLMQSLVRPMERQWFSGQMPSTAAAATTFFEQAEEFIVSRMVNFLAVVFPSFQNLGYFVLVGLLLMLLAVTSYPFEPRNEFLFFNWVVILSFIGTIFWIFVQMDRDTVLSLLNGGTPGQINISSELVLRAFLYIGAPLLALLGAQFPETLSKILSVLTTAQGGG